MRFPPAVLQNKGMHNLKLRQYSIGLPGSFSKRSTQTKAKKQTKNNDMHDRCESHFASLVVISEQPCSMYRQIPTVMFNNVGFGARRLSRSDWDPARAESGAEAQSAVWNQVL